MSPIPGLEFLHNRLNAMRRAAIGLDLMQWLLIVVGGLLLFGAVVSAVAWWWIPSTMVRLSVVIALFAFIVGTLIWLIVKRTQRPGGLIPYAVDVEQSHPQIRNRLVASLELAEDAEFHGYSPELVGLTIQQAAELSEGLDFRRALDRKPVRRWGKLCLGVATIAVIGIVLFPGLARKSWEAYSQPTKEFIEPIPYELAVSPGAAEAIKFDDFDIKAVLSGSDLPHRARVYFRADGGQWRDAEMTLNSGDRAGNVHSFAHRFVQVKRDFEYYVVAGKRSSLTYNVSAVDRPRMTGLRLEYQYPQHTGKESEVIDENDGTIVAPVGTVVKMTLESNRDLASAAFVFSDGRERPWSVSGTIAEAELNIAENVTYHIRLTDAAERSNPHPIEYSITAIPDRAPTVEILLPGHNTNLGDDLSLNLRIAARDDYGFSKMNLVTTWISEGRVRGEAEKRTPIGGQGSKGAAWDVVHYWDLSTIGMMPSDVVEYYVEVFDNDAIEGAKRGVSKTYSARLPSLDEMIAEVEQRYDRGVHDLEDVLHNQREMSEKLQNLRRELLKTEDLNWDRREQIKDLAASQGALEEKLEDLAQSFQEVLAEQEQRSLASSEMLQKLAEAQQLFQEVATEEMREQVRKLQEAMEKLSPDEVEKAMEKMQLSQEDLINSLDRTIDYLKRLQAEQKMDALVQRAKDLKAQQDNLNEEVGKSNADELPTKSPTEDRLEKQTEDLLSDIAAAEEMLKDSKVGTPSQVDQFTDAAKQCQAPNSMKNASQSMNSKNKPSSESSGKKASDQLGMMIGQMEQAMEQMKQQNMADVSQELRRALDQSLYLSENQEDLHNLTDNIRPGEPALRDLAAEQMALRQAAQHLAQDLSEIAKKSMCIGGKLSTQMGDALMQMDRSASALSNRNGPSAVGGQRAAMSSLNQLSQSILEGMDKNSGQCQNPGQCSNPNGAAGQMESLARRQGKVNSQMPMPGMNGSSMGMEERQSLSRLKAEQEAIKEGVEGMQQQHGGRRDLLGRLDKLGEEMQKVLDDMEKRNISQETVNRQRRVLSRMLDFQLSLQRQDFKEDRRAHTGDDYMRASPDELPFDAGITDADYERLLTQYRDEVYPREYEETIKNYFEALSADRQR